jgi:type VI secretion system protein ImpG
VGGEQLTNADLREETLSIQAWCTNGVLPREEIRDNTITKPGPGLPDFVMVSNITRPTLPAVPPASEEYLWIFLSHLGANFSTLASADALKSLLRLYDWSKSEGRKRRIDSIAEVSSGPAEAMVMGTILRGVEFTVTLSEAEFQDVGDLHLFGEVLKEFLSSYVTINSFLRLTFVLKPSGEQIRWDSLKGKRWLI